jgi:hypothetical protein
MTKHSTARFITGGAFCAYFTVTDKNNVADYFLIAVLEIYYQI